MDNVRLDKIKDIKTSHKEKNKGKKADKLTSKEKDDLLFTIARMLDLID